MGRVVLAALLVVCGWYCVALAHVFVRAVPFPFELEWAESASLCMAHRVATGQPLYTAPSIEHTPVPYPPLFFFLGGHLARWVGLGLPMLRLLSLAAFVATAAGIAWLVRRETTSWAAAFVAVGCYAACFELSGAWYHLARIDSLFVCCLWWGLAVLHRAASHRAALLAAALFFLAFLAKQTLLLFLPFLLVIVWLAKRRWMATFAASLGVAISIAVSVGNDLTDGWFRFYIFDFQVQRGFDLVLLLDYVKQFLVPLALFLTAVALAWSRGARHAWEAARRQWPWLLSAAASLAVALSAIAQPGGAANNAMPFCACLSTLVGLGFAHFAQEAGLGTARVGYCLLVGSALATLWYDPEGYAPHPVDYSAGRRVVEALAGLPDPVWIPHTASYYFLAGHRPFAHQATLWDIGRSDAVEAKRELVAQILAGISRHAFAGVVLGREEGLIHEALRQHGYRPVRLQSEPDGLWTKTGLRWRPEVLFLRDADTGPGGRPAAPRDGRPRSTP